LLQASQWKLRSTRRRLLLPRDERGKVLTVDRRRWKQRADHQRRIKGLMPKSEPGAGLLQRALDPESTRGPTARELAVASLRLVPRTEAIMCVATMTSHEGERGRAQELYQRALEGCPSDFLSGLIFQNLAALSCSGGGATRRSSSGVGVRRSRHRIPSVRPSPGSRELCRRGRPPSSAALLPA
jgi:hypothetical protein